MRNIALATALLPVAQAFPTLFPRWALPVVDLGYELHQAISYNEAAGYYNFSNIPFAAPPVGDLRFKAPQPPAKGDRSKPNNGAGPKICPQGSPGWGAVTYPFFLQYATLLASGPVNNTVLNSIPVLNEADVAVFNYAPKPGESEDCLYLDIMVPDGIFNGKQKAPVLVEIYGGGYVAGDKVSVSERSGSAAGLITRGNSSFIYVALNYRLGAFGFSAGPEFECAGGDSNAGLLDQRAALEWIQKYIHLFGGDASQVTVIGESAGGGSIEHQITAYGGKKGPVPFQRAISQSPGFSPIRWNKFTDSAWEGYLQYSNASSFKQLQSLPGATLQLANAQQNFFVPPVGGYVYGPVVDGSFVPDLPGVSFAQGNFDKNVHILAGQNRREGYLFTNPAVRTDADIIRTLQGAVGAPLAAAQYVVSTLYPPNYDGSLGYTNWYERIATITSEFAFICNDYYMLSATAQQSYGYLFNIFPGFHGQDIPYTFFNGFVNASNPNTVQNANAAYTLQDWIASFALGRAPDTHVSGSPNLPLYDGGQQIGAINGALGQFQPAIVKNPAANPRCQWWQQGLFAPDSAAAIAGAVKDCKDCD